MPADASVGRHSVASVFSAATESGFGDALRAFPDLAARPAETVEFVEGCPIWRQKFQTLHLPPAGRPFVSIKVARAPEICPEIHVITILFVDLRGHASPVIALPAPRSIRCAQGIEVWLAAAGKKDPVSGNPFAFQRFGNRQE